jgi:hypothetical protein
MTGEYKFTHIAELQFQPHYHLFIFWLKSFATEFMFDFKHIGVTGHFTFCLELVFINIHQRMDAPFT